MRYANRIMRLGVYLLVCAPLLLHGNTSAAASAQVALEKALKDKPQEFTGVSFYPSCAALRADLMASFDEMWLQDKAWISAAIGMDNPIWGSGKDLESEQPTAEAAEDAGVEGATNVQEKGVDEADRFRVGGSQIFALSSDEHVQILDRSSFRSMGSLYFPGFTQTQLLTATGRLIVLGQVNTKPGQDVTIVRVYSTSAANFPVLLAEQRYLGSFFTSRLLGDQLLLMVRDAIPDLRVPVSTREFQEEPWFPNAEKRRRLYEMRDQLYRRILPPIRDGRIQGVACERYIRRPVRDWDLQLSKTYLINVRDEKALVSGRPEALGMIGSADELYVTTRNLYVLKQRVQWFTPVWWGQGDVIDTIPATAQDERLRIQQVSLENGFLEPRSAGQVSGRIKDRWSIRELKEGRYLAIATTTGYLGGWGGEPALNHLFIVAPDGKGQLVKRASIENFAPKEDIRSVRYIGDYAYIVTFEKTDPLFAFDLRDPEHPRLLSELKIPGFSTYMHPLGDGRLIGVGFDTVDQGDYSLFQGIKVSLFGIADPTEINELQEPLIYGVRGSSSEVATDPKAFFLDAQSGLVGIPVIALRSVGEWGTERDFSGAILLKLNGSRMVEEARFTHVEWVAEACRKELDTWRWWQDARPSLDINRVYRFGDQIITLSRWGLKAYRTGQWNEPTVALSFPPQEASCSTSIY